MLRVWLLLFFCASVLEAFDIGLNQHWELWKETYQKKYLNKTEESFRRAVWEKNVKQINIHNLKEDLGLHSYRLGTNQLSDLTKEELGKMYANLRIPKDIKCEKPTVFEVRDVDLPKDVDWRKSGLVTNVKNQGGCGSCWAFSTVGALEGFWAKKTKGKKKAVSLSPQNLVDCAGQKYGNFGCGGGLMHGALQYVIDNKGIESEASYPYKAKDGNCKYDASLKAANCSAYGCVEENELSLKKASALVGPIAVAINADEIFSYKSGVFDSVDCNKLVNHGVLLVGYGTDSKNGLDYWLIKNSWGEAWGEKGYLSLARNHSQLCGISTYSVYPK